MSGAPIQTRRGPDVVVVAGRSMEPGLQEHFRLRVGPVGPLPDVGDVVLIRSAGAAPAPGFVVHRVVATSTSGPAPVVFHRGDAGGRVGMTRAESVVGRITTVLTPAGRSVPRVSELDAGQRGAFERARKRCRVYVRLRDAGAHRAWSAGTRRLAVLARRLLLRA